jgi:hypothetical protein
VQVDRIGWTRGVEGYWGGPSEVWRSDLELDAATTLPDHLGFQSRGDDEGWHIDVITLSGDLVWANYAQDEDQLCAWLCAEQRYLVEQVGTGAMPGSTFRDRAEERVRRWIDGT